MLKTLAERYRAETSELPPGGVYLVQQKSNGDWQGFAYAFGLDPVNIRLQTR